MYQINGAAAYLVKIGHTIIVISYSPLDDASTHSYELRVILVNAGSAIIEAEGKPGQVPLSHGLRNPGGPTASFRK